MGTKELSHSSKHLTGVVWASRSHEVLGIFQIGEWLMLVPVPTQEAFVTHEIKVF